MYPTLERSDSSSSSLTYSLNSVQVTPSFKTWSCHIQSLKGVSKTQLSTFSKMLMLLCIWCFFPFKWNNPRVSSEAGRALTYMTYINTGIRIGQHLICFFANRLDLKYQQSTCRLMTERLVEGFVTELPTGHSD